MNSYAISDTTRLVLEQGDITKVAVDGCAKHSRGLQEIRFVLFAPTAFAAGYERAQRCFDEE
jgi:hypothetical protein